MVIYIDPDGSWIYDWEINAETWVDLKAVRVDLDRLDAYKDLTPLQIKACEEALSE